MHRWSADLLEYESLRAIVRRYVASPMGRARLDEMEPSTDREALEESLADVGQAMLYQREAEEPLRFGGIPEVVRDGETGFLVALGDAAAMADRLEQLLKDAALTAQLGRQAAVHARQAFDLQRQVESYLDWYQEMQGQTQPAR